MKTLRIFLSVTLIMSIALAGFAQKTRTESFKVAGECGMCKKKIEKSALSAGATSAAWDQQSKILKVSYPATLEVSAIQQSIANSGYDTPVFKATDAAYNSLDKCCQYDRQAAKANSCCDSDDCKMKDGKCTDMTACKEKGCCKDDADCAKKGCCDKTAAPDKTGTGEKQ